MSNPGCGQYELAEAIERDLGDPYQPESQMSLASSVHLDEREEFPTDSLNWLYGRKLQKQFVPVALGGEFRSFEELSSLIRALSRRDLTAGITFSTLFWSFLTWMAGTEEQKRRLAEFIIEENGAMCLAYSERVHGSDLVASDTIAQRATGGFLLTGEKWPINRATVAGLCYVLARTDPDAGPRGLSLFMAYKKDLAPESYTHLPKIRTHGIRGSDMSGIRFDSCLVAEQALLGGEGKGLEFALKGFQITRALCAAFSQGAADTALRTTLRFAIDRELYGHRVVDLPHAKNVFVRAFVNALVGDCVMTACMRALHTVPQQFSVWASVTKYFVPVTLERMTRDLSVILGARYYMREEHDWGIFQKVLRDGAIISVFDGSTVVNLHALLLQLRSIARLRWEGSAEQRSRIERIFSLDQQVAEFEPHRMSLASREPDDAWHGLPTALQRLRDMSPTDDLDAETLGDLEVLVSELSSAMREHDTRLMNSSFVAGHMQPSESFESAKKHCILHAAATCVQMWVWSRDSLPGFFGEGAWLVLALRGLLHDAGVATDHPPKTRYADAAMQALLALLRENRLFSITGLRLASKIEAKGTET